MVVPEEKDYRKYGLIGTVVVHAALLALFLLIAFTGPNPPLEGGSGIELNYGLDAEGSGDIQSMAQANESQNREDSKPASSAEERTPTPQETPQEKVEEIREEKIITGVDDAPVAVKDVEKAKTREEPKEEVKAVEKPKSLYPGKSVQNGANGVAGNSNQATGNNNGDRDGKVGDQGNPEGSLDAKALYGKPGKGGPGNGPGLNMPGWAFDRPPKPDDNSNESGRIIFDIKIDKDGTVTYCGVRESNVSPALTKLYKDAVTRSTLSPTNASGAADVGASGTVTFIIKAR